MKENLKDTQTLIAREQALIAQLRQHPELMERLEIIVGLTGAEGGKLRTADEVEEQLIEEVRRLGNQVIRDWAANTEARVGQELEQSQPAAGVRKKKS